MNTARVGTFGTCLGAFLSSKYISCVLKLTNWQILYRSRPNRQLWNAQICSRWIFWDWRAGHFTPIFLSPQGRLHALKDYYHYLWDILASYRWSEYFDHVEHRGWWVNSFIPAIISGWQLIRRSHTVHTILCRKASAHISRGSNPFDRCQWYFCLPCYFLSHGSFCDGGEHLESTNKVVLHWRRPTLFIQGSVTKRTSLLFVSLLVASMSTCLLV